MSSYIEVTEKLFKSQMKTNVKDYINRYVEKYNILLDIFSCQCNISIQCNCDPNPEYLKSLNMNNILYLSFRNIL